VINRGNKSLISTLPLYLFLLGDWVQIPPSPLRKGLFRPRFRHGFGVFDGGQMLIAGGAVDR